MVFKKRTNKNNEKMTGSLDNFYFGEGYEKVVV